MSTKANTALDAAETQLVAQSMDVANLTNRELTLLVRQLRERRERIKRAVRGRARQARQDGKIIADTGAKSKKAELISAIERVSAVIEARKPWNWDGEAVRGPSTPTTKPKAQPKVKTKAKASAKAKVKTPSAVKPKAETKPASKAKAAAKSEDKPKAK